MALSPGTSWDEPTLYKVLIGQLAGVVGVPSAEIDSAKSFDEYGLDSIDAVLATESIGQQLGVELPPEFLFLHRSVDAVVRALLDGQHTDRPANTPQGREAPIFLFPGGGGRDDSALIRFRAQCPRKLTFEVVRIGLWRDWIEHDLDFEKIIDRACRYIEAIAPEEPLRFLGYSQGGQLAYGTALALARAGRPVQFVGLLDPIVWRPSPLASTKSSIKFIKDSVGRTRRYVSTRIRGRRNAHPPGHARMLFVSWLCKWCRGPTELRKLHLLISRLGRVLFHGPGGVRLDLIIQMQLFSDMWTDWLQNGSSRSLHSPVFLFRSESSGTRDYGWGAYCSNLTVVPVAGDHYTMFDAEHLEELVARFVAAVEHVEKPDGILEPRGYSQVQAR